MVTTTQSTTSTSARVTTTQPLTTRTAQAEVALSNDTKSSSEISNSTDSPILKGVPGKLEEIMGEFFQLELIDKVF